MLCLTDLKINLNVCLDQGLNEFHFGSQTTSVGQKKEIPCGHCT